jgi:SWI/SNF-related matrix-associated actin-dependent regulator of chromatin subfamily A member 5
MRQKAQNYIVPAAEPEEGQTAEEAEAEVIEEQERINNGMCITLFLESS